MDANTTNITVNLATTNNFGIVKAVQGDMKTRFVHITLLNNQVEYDFTDVYPVLRGTKPDGMTIFNECTISAENRIIVELTEQMLAKPGVSTYEIALYAVPVDLMEEKQVITTFPFTLIVSKAAFDPKAVASTDEFTAIANVIGNNAFLQGCLDDIAASRDAAKISEINASDSEHRAKTSEMAAKASETAAENSYMLSKSYAVGTNNVTRPDDTTDNSRYYSERSKDQAAAASTSATASAASEQTAIQKAAESAASAVLSRSWAVGDTDSRSGETTNNARYYSEQSKTYADSWKGSLLPKGTIPFAQLPVSDNVAGHMYNILDAFETDSRFKGGAGYAYPAGTNVYWTVNGKWDCLSGVLTMELTMAEYNALSETQKMNGTIYYISDADNSLQVATEQYDGLMSQTDKAKLDGIEDGATKIIVDDTISATSENAVQNKAITNALSTRITDHNASPDAHADIRDLISALTTQLNTLTDSDDTSLDQLSEIVAYIKSNRALIENITANGGLEIVDSLTSTATNKSLSANQGKILNDLIVSLTEMVQGIKEENDNIIDDQTGIYKRATDYTDRKIADLNNHVGDDTLHITASERQAWNDKQTKAGDTLNNTVTFSSADSTAPTAWTDVPVLSGGEKHSSILSKISTMFRNIRYLYKMLGTADISAIGDGTVNGALNSLNTGLGDLENNNIITSTPNTNAGIIADLQAAWQNLRTHRTIYYGNGGDAHFGLVNKFNAVIGSILLMSNAGHVIIYNHNTGSIDNVITTKQLVWRCAGIVTGANRLSLPDHSEVYIAVDFQSSNSYRRSLLIPNITCMETDLIAQVNEVIDYVHIYYEQTWVGMAYTSNPLGLENFKLTAWYR